LVLEETDMKLDPVLEHALHTVIEAIALDRVKHGMTVGEARVAVKLEVSSQQFEDVLEIICLIGLINLEPVASTPRGGRPTQRILIEPHMEKLKQMRREKDARRAANLEHIAKVFHQALKQMHS
jgi:hypothetical protein